MDDPAFKDPEAILSRKKIAGEIANSLEIIERQDSLQRIANILCYIHLRSVPFVTNVFAYTSKKTGGVAPHYI